MQGDQAKTTSIHSLPRLIGAIVLGVVSSSGSPPLHAQTTTGTDGGVVYSSDNVYPAAGAGSYSAQGSSYNAYIGAHMRARYNTRSYGQTRGNLDLGTSKFYQTDDGLWFMDGQVTINDDSGIGYNVGFGYRFLTLPLLPNSPDQTKIAGVSFWSDGSSTINDHFVSQAGMSLEYLGDRWDLRGNASIPFEDSLTGRFQSTGDIAFSGDFLVQQTIAGVDEPLALAEAEIARRLGDLSAWALAGVYTLDGDTTDTTGYKLGLRGMVTPDISLQFAVTDDDFFGTNAVMNLTWFIGRSRGDVSQIPWECRRMREPVIRNDYVAIAQRTATSGVALTGDVNGDGSTELIRITHVDSTAAAGGDGSFENPLNDLGDINSASQDNSIVLVHSGSSFNGQQPAALRDGQSMLGEGAGVTHTVLTTQFGSVDIPETAPGAQAGAIPTITNAASDAITLAATTTEVSNLSISGGDRAIAAGPDGNVGANLNNLTIANTTGNGIELTPGTFLLNPADPTSTQAALAPIISQVTFSNIGGNDIDLDSTSPAPALPFTEFITISDVTSTGGAGSSIVMQNNTAAATIAVSNTTITGKGGSGVVITDSDATHNFTNVDITDTAGNAAGEGAFSVMGGTASVNYTGSITQSSNASALAVTEHTTGSLAFSESTTGAGVITATNGDGLQFVNADGEYTFNNRVTLAGGDAGIDILEGTDGSDGTFTFAEGSITKVVGSTDAAIRVESGGAALSYTGLITQPVNNATIEVVGAPGTPHTGALVFNESTAGAGVINTTNGTGLQFDEADGTYTFNSAVTLDGNLGAGTQIDINTDSDGTFTFADASITNADATGLNINGGSSVVTYTGTINQAAFNQAAVMVTDHAGATAALTVAAPIGTTDAITASTGTGLQFSNADGDYNFASGVQLTGANTVVNIVAGSDAVNGSEGNFMFADTNVATGAAGDTAFTLASSTADVDFSGTIDQTSANRAVSITNHTTGTVQFNEFTAGTDVITGTNSEGILLSDADGNYNFLGGVTLTGGAQGIDVLSDSDGVIIFTDATITNPTDEAIHIDGGSSSVVLSGEITKNTPGATVLVSGGHGGTSSDSMIGAGLTISAATGATDAINTTNGTGLQFNNADGTYIFNNSVVLNGGDAGIDISNNSAGIFTFTDTTITNPTNEAISIDGGSAAVTFTGEIAKNSAGATVEVTGGHGGNAFDGTTAAGLTVNAATGATNAINATNGTGLQFDNADGVYNFNDSVVLDSNNTADTGIDILNGSDGDFTFANTTIDDVNGIALAIDGGSSDVEFTGSITQDNNFAAVSVSGGHGGTSTGGGPAGLLIAASTAATNSIEATSGTGLQFDNADAVYRMNGNILLNGGDAGVDIVGGSSGTFTFLDSTSTITNPTGDAFVVANSNAGVTYNGTITNNSGNAVRIESNTGGNADFNGQITDTASGLLVQNNTGGQFTFNGGSDLDTTTNTAVTLATNTGTTIGFQNLDINTTTGDGFSANATEGLSITGSGNTITTTTGTGLSLVDTTVAAAGVTLDSVSVDGAVNGVVLNNVTGGAVTIGSPGGAVGAGGTIQNTTGAGVLITNVQAATLNSMEIGTAGATNDGVELVHDNGAAFNVTINDSTIRNTSGQGVSLTGTGAGVVTLGLNGNTIDNNTQESILLDLNNNVSVANITIGSGNQVTNSNNEEALLLTAAGGNGKTVNLLINGSTFANDDPTAPGVDLQANGSVNLNATVTNNFFNSSDAVSGRPIEISANNGAANVRLNLRDNNATAASGGDEYFLVRTAGTFSIQDLTTAAPDDVETINGGDFNFGGGIGNFNNDPGGIPTP